MRPLLLAIAALVLGFSLGWLAHRSTVRPVSAAVPIKTIAPNPAAAPASVPQPTPVIPGAAADSRHERRARIETLRWLRESGMPVNFQVFQGDKFNAVLGKALGLNEAETARLALAAQVAKAQLEASRAASATSRVAADGILHVEVPALDVAASGVIYDQLRTSFESTLGPERLETFNELAGEAFERSFDRFGLNAVRYEVSPPSRAPGNSQTMFLPYKRSFVEATGSGSGWSTGQLLLGDIERHDGLLAKILPPAFKAPPGPP